MSVSHLEQRFMPLVQSEPAWRPWGPLSMTPAAWGSESDAEEENCAKISGTEGSGECGTEDYTADIDAKRRQRRCHSWSGYTPFALDKPEREDRTTWQSTAADSHTALEETRDTQPQSDEPFPNSPSQGFDYQVSDSASQGDKHADDASCANSSADASLDEASVEPSPSEENNAFVFETERGHPPFALDGADAQDQALDTETADRIAAVYDEFLAKGITTLMLRNIAKAHETADLVTELDRCGYADQYDFCYVPRTFKTGQNRGIAFINFVNVEAAAKLKVMWHQKRTFCRRAISRPLYVEVARVQGRDANLQMASSNKIRRIRTHDFRPYVAMHGTF